MSRIALVALAVLSVMAPARVLATAASGGDSDAGVTTTIDNSFLDTERDLSECLDHSIQRPNCGREPTAEGDRGGALQLATFAVMGLGLAFVGWRVTRAIRARDAALGSRPS